MTDEWSPPDTEGIRTLTLDLGARSTLRGRRLRRADRVDPAVCSVWPQDHLALLREWLIPEVAQTRFATLMKTAGHTRAELARQVLRDLLLAGWVEIEERRESGRWNPTKVCFLNRDELRPLVGLKSKGEVLDKLRELKSRPLAADLGVLRADLERIPAELAARRMKLLITLDAWITERRFGTRRDFALYASGATKGIPASDWEWLDARLNLDDHGIRRHIPFLHIRAPWRLIGSCTLDLRGVPDCIGLSPKTLAGVSSIEGEIEAWCFVENLTLFERVAERYGWKCAVLWLPGNPPEWWMRTIDRLLRLCPAPVRIACDPDPAGIQIAVAAGELCRDANQAWHLWGMSVECLKSIPKHQKLTKEDESILAALKSRELPVVLRQLAQWMGQEHLKGEQEGLSLSMLEQNW